MRIAIAGFMHESNTFNPIKADRPAFVAQSLVYGPRLVDEWRQAHHEVAGFIEAVESNGHTAVPIVMAWAVPSGPVTADVFNEVVDRIIRDVKEQKPDGLLLGLHGAMVSDVSPDGDGEVLYRLRQALGKELPMVVTLDLHGNVSQRVVDNSTAVIAYRTCPHVDQRERGKQAAELLFRTLKKEIRPVQALAKPPVIVNIMVHDSSQEPLRGLMAEARAIEKKPGIVAVSLLPGFAYADVPQMGPSIIVVADGDTALARSEADRLGKIIWDARDRLVRKLPDASEAVMLALKADKLPVVLVETGDNVGGGSAGDATFVLGELLRQGASDSVVCLYAPEEVRQCAAAGIGAEVRLTVGGKVDRLHGDPVSVTGKVRVLQDGMYVEPEVRHGGKRINNMGLSAVVELPNRNLLVLNSLRHPPFSAGQLTCVGIDPRRQRIIVVKAAIAYKAAYAPLAGAIIEVDTPGLTAVNPERFAYQHITRPMYPLS